MTDTIRIKRRIAAGGAGAPSTLANAEMAYNEFSHILYYGEGTGGSGGSASSIVPIGGSGSFLSLTLGGTVAAATTFSNGLTVSAGSLNVNNGSITNVGAPVNPNDAANKNYVDATVQGLQIKPTARLCTAAALPANTATAQTLTGNANGAIAVDSVTMNLNDVVLVIHEAAAQNNGLYTCTQSGDGTHPWILTRHADMNIGTETVGAFVPVGNASLALSGVNSNTLWLANPTPPVTIGTTPIPWTQLNAQTSYTAGPGISIGAGMISAVGTVGRIGVSGAGIDIAANYVGQTSITTLGTITTGTWNGTVIAVVNGGTGAVTAAAACANIQAASLSGNNTFSGANTFNTSVVTMTNGLALTTGGSLAVGNGVTFTTGTSLTTIGAGGLTSTAGPNNFGTIASGTWNGTVIGVAYGGTGAVTAAAACANIQAAYLSGNNTFSGSNTFGTNSLTVTAGLALTTGGTFTTAAAVTSTFSGVVNTSAALNVNSTLTTSTGLTTIGSGGLTSTAGTNNFGTIASGTWNGTVIGVAYGGTGAVTAAAACANIQAAYLSGNNTFSGTNTFNTNVVTMTNGLSLTTGGSLTTASGVTTTFSGAVIATTQAPGNSTTLVATTAFVAGAIAAQTVCPTARVATAAALPANTYASGPMTLTATANGPLTVDGVTVATGDYVLVKNEAAGANNGEYVVTQPGVAGTSPYILTRASAMNNSAAFVGSTVAVGPGGATNANTNWVCTNTGAFTMGTTVVTFGPLGVSSFNTRQGAVTLTGADVTGVNGALTNATNSFSVLQTFTAGLQMTTGGTFTTAAAVGTTFNGAVTTAGTLSVTNGLSMTVGSGLTVAPAVGTTFNNTPVFANGATVSVGTFASSGSGVIQLDGGTF